MASTGNFYTATKVVNGVTTLISLGDWAKETLSADDYVKFQAAAARQAAIFEAAKAAGTVVITPIAPVDGEVKEGVTYVFNGVITDDPEWRTFAAQYAKDPSLTRPDDHTVLTEI